ncbi:alpha-E domain-containing protein [Sphingorhabdus sp. 109]|jgi:uncharacterized alpha-E superfamily protein|uniref:alpha-E domain-containing protein n=1 Tax=Sphingorhabdus sp. 109 TaxID=2653173 RepID=UPI0012EFB5A8|nr:alpha-E domain-containing protein [Sphingorhabdus sp. 109]VWX57799.1 conserved hypothetical protein [Sphingorhabdus sp. 109]
MLGKTAASLFWMSRYLERVENSARFIEAGFRIALTRSASASDEWSSVLKSSGVLQAYRRKHVDFDSVNVIDFLLRDRDNTNSVMALTKKARDSARTARTALTREVWEATNESWITLNAAMAKPVREQDLPETLGLIRNQSALVRGATLGTMLRNDGFNFLRLGSFLERADSTARILDVKYYLLLPSVALIGSSVDNVQWETILRSVSAHRSFRWLNGPDISAQAVADYLILHRQMPRSLTFCYAKISDNLNYIDDNYGIKSRSGELAHEICTDILRRPIEAIFDYGLHEYIADFIRANNGLAAQIETDFNFHDRVG